MSHEIIDGEVVASLIGVTMSVLDSLSRSKSVQFSVVFVAIYVVFAIFGYSRAIAEERSYK